MSGDDERDDLLTDVDRVQPASGDGVCGIQHQVQQVASLRTGAVAAGLDHVVDDASHHRADRRMAGRSSRVSSGNVDQLAYFSIRFIAEMNACGRRRSKEPNG